MKFVINTKTFEKLLSGVLTVAPAHSPVEVLQNIRLTIKDKKLTLGATDTQVFYENWTNIESDTDIDLIFPGRILYDTIKTIEDTDIKFEIDDTKKMKLVTNTGEYEISFFEANLFPSFPELKNPVDFTIKGNKLKRALESTIFAASKEEARIVMSGVLLEIFQEEIRFVATDGHRLVKISFSDIKNKINRKIVIPSKSLNFLVKFLSEFDVIITFDGSYIKFESDHILFLSRLIDEQYPNYESVIPVENNNIMEIDRNSIIKSLKRASLYTNTSTKQVRLSIQNEDLSVLAENIDLGYNANEKILCEYSGTPLEIAFNASILSELLQNFDSEKLIFKMQSPTRACIIEPNIQKEEENLLVLIMPMRINT